MTTGICRSALGRNISSSSLPSNHSTITDAEWITNGISLVIFLFAFLGNTAALIVMFASRGPIRLTNNKYLANLACADLLRACFIPFTIIARMKRNFIFGKFLCKVLPIVQGLSVAVDVFTLVCISIERYLAICRPLLTLKLQSLRFSHLFNLIVLFCIWFFALLTALPNFYMYNLCFLPNLRRFKCEKHAPEMFDERIYMIILDVFYLVIPMTMMIILYTLIILKMSRKNLATRMRSCESSINSRTYSPSPVKSVNLQLQNIHRCVEKSLSSENSSKDRRGRFFDSLRIRSNRESSSSLTRMDRHRRKALKLLIVLIIEFFVCWTPLYIYHTIGTFSKDFYRSVPTVLFDIFLLFSFASASCNPLTYYFMSQRYRTVLYANLSILCFQKNQAMLIYQKHRSNPQSIRNLPTAPLRTSLEKKGKTQTLEHLRKKISN